jgi:Ca2+:H+ antiporter
MNKHSNALTGRANLTADQLELEVVRISRAAAIILLISFAVYTFFQMKSHHSIYDDILEDDEANDADRHRDLAKPKLTLTESIVALALAITFVSMMAVFLVQNIEPIVENHGVSDSFVGLILVPLVEKAAEHITAIDEAWDNQMNFALSHILGASIQTALLNTPLAVIVGWGLVCHLRLHLKGINLFANEIAESTHVPELRAIRCRRPHPRHPRGWPVLA